MTANQKESHQANEPELILRGVKKLETGEFDTTVMLFKGKDENYLQGFVKVGDTKHMVLAHIHERKADDKTGQIKPNFLKLSEPHAYGDNINWKEIGFGNAVNQRKDDKTVYFDEVLFSVDKEIISARLSNNVSNEFQQKLGFQQERAPRPKDNPPQKEASQQPSPSMAQAPEETPKAAKSRRNARVAA